MEDDRFDSFDFVRRGPGASPAQERRRPPRLAQRCPKKTRPAGPRAPRCVSSPAAPRPAAPSRQARPTEPLPPDRRWVGQTTRAGAIRASIQEWKKLGRPARSSSSQALSRLSRRRRPIAARGKKRALPLVPRSAGLLPTGAGGEGRTGPPQSAGGGGPRAFRRGRRSRCAGAPFSADVTVSMDSGDRRRLVKRGSESSRREQPERRRPSGGVNRPEHGRRRPAGSLQAFASDGSSRHDSHQVAQKLTTSTRPRWGWTTEEA